MPLSVTALLRKVDKVLGRRPTSYPYISGDSFRAISQHVYGDPKTDLDPSRVKAGDVIFIKADKIKDFMRDIHPRISVQYVVISHNSDAVIDESFLSFIEEKNIITWFAQNAAVAHPKLIPIPIGLENLYYHVNGEKGIFDMLRKKNAKGAGSEITKKFRILFGFNVNTNKMERIPALDFFSKHPLADNIATATGSSAFPNPPLYFKTLNEYGFVASPPGNGIDCHRTWEAMYLDVTPIVKKSVATEYFRSLGLPLMCVDSWDEVPQDERALREKYQSLWTNGAGEAVWMDYWIKKIDQARHEA